jgi:hypothetical protein
MQPSVSAQSTQNTCSLLRVEGEPLSGLRRNSSTRRRARSAVTLLAGLVGLVIATGELSVGAATGAQTTPLWPIASELALPANAAPSAGGNQDAEPGQVTCTSAGNCVTVGGYADTSTDSEPFVSTETNGAWNSPIEPALPSGADPVAGDEEADLGDVACTSPGNCVAGGEYTDGSGPSDDDYQAMTTTETNGVWAAAVETVLPTPHDTAVNGQDAAIDGLSCTSVGNCVGVGGYEDTSDDYQAMTVIETSGVWAQAVKLALPAGAGGAGAQNAYLDHVTCTSAGNCVAVGDYEDTGANEQALIATETSGTWSSAKLTLPSDNYTGAHQYGQLADVYCTGVGNCVAVGVYTNTADKDAPMIATETSGTWTQASTAPTPQGEDGNFNDLASVTCVSLGNCVAGGEYENGSHHDAGYFATETSGAWAPPTTINPPANADTTAHPYAYLDSVTCTSLLSCVAAGAYEDTNDNYETMVVSSVLTPAISTASLPAASLGVPYSGQLSATAGTGSYAWSVDAGALPAGLTLNASSGAISGTPTGLGTSNFTIALGDNGIPGLVATLPLSILVNGSAVGTAHLGGVRVKGQSATVTVACAQFAVQTCAGKLTITAVEHGAGHTLTAVSAHKKPKKKTHTVTLASSAYSVSGATSASVKVTLNAAGKELVKRFHSLHAELVLTPSSSATATAKHALSFTYHKPKPKKKHHS